MANTKFKIHYAASSFVFKKTGKEKLVKQQANEVLRNK